MAVAASALFTGQLTPQAPEPRSPGINQPVQVPDDRPDVGEAMKMKDVNGVKTFETANTDRKRQISDDSAILVKLATELKNAVDMTSKDTLSIGIIRKADEIERLAREVRLKMKLTAGAN
jgi:hypothetical protein